LAFCVPVFDDDELLGFSVTTAHHLDIGAHTPGSCGIVDAVDAYAEGLQFKAIKVVDQGRRNDVVWQMVHDNIRIPDLVVGDMNAHIAAATGNWARSATCRLSPCGRRRCRCGKSARSRRCRPEFMGRRRS